MLKLSKKVSAIILAFTIGFTAVNSIGVIGVKTAIKDSEKKDIINVEDENWVIQVNKDGSKYLLEKNSGKEIGESYGYDKNGNLKKISPEERLALINKTKQSIKNEKNQLINSSRR